MITEAIWNYIKATLHVVSDNGINQCVALTDGKSGAEVYRVHIVSRRSRESGSYIVKLIDIKSKWYDASNNEAKKSSQIYAKGNLFKDRLVECCADEIIDGYHVLLCRQANDSVINTTMVDKLKISEQMKVLRMLSYEILEKWNKNAIVESEAEDLIDKTLSYRLDDDGAFEKKMEQILEDSTCDAFMIQDRVYPNPLFYLKKQREWMLKRQGLSFFNGNIHGDLHRRNILCEKEFSNYKDIKYCVIDYDSYREDGLLLFDQAYLELSIYVDHILNNAYGSKQWEDTIISLLEKSVYEELKECIDEPLMYLRNAICKGVSDWANEQYPHMRDSIEIQFLLSRVMAAVNYFSKGAIDDHEVLLKILKYMGTCFKILFEKIQHEWTAEKVSKLTYALSKDDYVEELWENCIKYTSNYIPVLITDDFYKKDDYIRIKEIARAKWSLVIDIGMNESPDDISTAIPEKVALLSNLNIYNLVNQNLSIEYSSGTCAWVIAKKDDQMPTYGFLWAHCQRAINKLFDQIMSCNGLRPFLFVFDLKKGQPFVQKFLQCALNNFERMRGSRFVALGNHIIAEDDISTIKAFECYYYAISSANLVNVAETIKKYFPPLADTSHTNSIIFPTASAIEPRPLTEKEIRYYESSVELVYTGLEGHSQDVDYGEEFYRGAEIKWSDLANDCDLKLIENYEKKRDNLLKVIEEDSPRVKSLKLVHGAGTGGTTLSKRLLWDLKELVPCMRLKKYTQDTANILLEIYRKTGKRVLLVVEMGSTILNGDDLNTLLSKVNEENGKLMVLQVERNNKNKDNEVDKESSFIKIFDTLQDPIARRFMDKFKKMTIDLQRQELLEKITNGLEEWQEQRSPFFYGFYTFQEEYNLSNIARTVSKCSDIIKELLSDLAIVTIYSQNICIRFSELPVRMHYDKEMYSPYMLYEQLETSVAKLIVVREDGWRICHPLIAKKILCEIYEVEDYCESIYSAASAFVKRLYRMYGSEDLASDDILKELIIDRSYIDSERTRFSSLVEDIPEFTKKKELFENLIELYSQNPHYYNHLARLLAETSSNAYEPSIKLLNEAIDIAEKQGLNSVVHYITLGCIYSKSIFAHIKEERRLMKQGRLSSKLSELIEEIKDHYALADGAFSKARQKTVKLNSYAYYPQIQMECKLIQNLVSYDKNGRTMEQMFEDDNAFRKWYREHFGKTVQLLAEMERHYEVFDKIYKEYLERAKSNVKGININNDKLEQQLLTWKGREGNEAAFFRRTYTSALYVRYGYNWKEADTSVLRTVVDSMHANVLQSSRQNMHQGDVSCWLEAFRQMPEFDAGEAISFLEDYKLDDYEKEYQLFWLHFLQLEKKLSSPLEVIKHINRCKDMVPAGINNISFRDAYVSYSTACPIRSYYDLQHNKRSLVGLQEFYGTITDIRGNTVGTIQLDEINLTAAFTTSLTDEKGRKREFTSENITDRVKFNLMFTYSGLRAWNVDAI